MNNSLNNILMQLNDCQRDHRPSLTPQFHHDRGRVVIAGSPRRGEYGPLGRPCGRKKVVTTMNRTKNVVTSNTNTILTTLFDQATTTEPPVGGLDIMIGRRSIPNIVQINQLDHNTETVI